MAWKRQRGETSEGGKFPGGTWHIFEHVVDKVYVNGTIEERKLWRGVVHIKHNDKFYWKGNADKHIIELWIRDKILECRVLKEQIHEEPKTNPKTKRRNTARAKEFLRKLHTQKPI